MISQDFINGYVQALSALEGLVHSHLVELEESKSFCCANTTKQHLQAINIIRNDLKLLIKKLNSSQ